MRRQNDSVSILDDAQYTVPQEPPGFGIHSCHNKQLADDQNTCTKIENDRKIVDMNTDTKIVDINTDTRIVDMNTDTKIVDRNTDTKIKQEDKAQ